MGTRLSGESLWRRSRITVPVAAPAAGAEWSLVVPGGHIYVPLAVHWRLVTSATVNSRVARLAIGDGVQQIVDVPPNASQAASLTYSYAWLPSPSGILTGAFMLSSLPEVELLTGWTIGSVTALLDAADQYDQVRVLVDDMTVRSGPVDLATMPAMIVELATGPTS